MTQAAFNGWLALWAVCMAGILFGQRHARVGAGLTISYTLHLWLNQWLAASIYALPWYRAPNSATALGLEQSTYAVAAFCVGSLLAIRATARSQSARSGQFDRPIDRRFVRTTLWIGAATYFAIEPVLAGIPTIGAVASAASNLLLVALAMECWSALTATPRRTAEFWAWLVTAATLPFFTIVTKGFLGYGFASMLTVFAFVASAYRPRWRLIGGAALIGFMAMSLYVTYMRDRRDIRAVVWGGESYSSRLQAFGNTLTTFEWFDPQNPDHLYRIDERLNQNFLLGRAVEELERSPENFAQGRTLWDAVLSIIPRFLWPDKPIVAGSGQLVTEFTGIRFARNTSVGIGHIMEWYVNFGTTGVVLGMLLLGLIVGWLDGSAALRLQQGDASGFVFFWLPGLSLLQVGGSMVEVVSSAAAALLIAIGLQRIKPVLVPAPPLAAMNGTNEPR